MENCPFIDGLPIDIIVIYHYSYILMFPLVQHHHHVPFFFEAKDLVRISGDGRIRSADGAEFRPYCCSLMVGFCVSLKSWDWSENSAGTPMFDWKANGFLICFLSHIMKSTDIPSGKLT